MSRQGFWRSINSTAQHVQLSSSPSCLRNKQNNINIIKVLHAGSQKPKCHTNKILKTQLGKKIIKDNSHISYKFLKDFTNTAWKGTSVNLWLLLQKFPNWGSQIKVPNYLENKINLKHLFDKLKNMGET